MCGVLRYGSPEQLCHACTRLAKALTEPLGEWVEEALCAQTDPEAFFPQHRGGTDKTAEVAKAVCAMCPVRRECHDYAMESKELWGVWGGVSEIERRKSLGIKGVRGATAA